MAQPKKKARRRILVGLVLYIAAFVGFVAFAYAATYDRQNNWSVLGYIVGVVFLVGLFFFAWGCNAWAGGKGYKASLGGILGIFSGLFPFFLLWGLTSLGEYSVTVVIFIFLLAVVSCISILILTFLPDKHKHSA